MGWGKEKSVEEADKFFLHILVDVAIAGEGFTAFLVAAEGANEVWVFDLLVEIPDEGASCQVAAGYFIQRTFLFCPGCRIEDSPHAI